MLDISYLVVLGLKVELDGVSIQPLFSQYLQHDAFILSLSLSVQSLQIEY